MFFLRFSPSGSLLAVIIQVERNTFGQDDLAEVDQCSVAPPLKSVAQFSGVAYEIRED